MQETFYALLLLLVVVELVRINPWGTNKTAVGFSNANQNGSIVGEKLRSPVTHITETLDNKFFAFQTFLNSQLF